MNKKSVSLKIPDKLVMIFRFQASPVGYTFGKAVKIPRVTKNVPKYGKFWSIMMNFYASQKM